MGFQVIAVGQSPGWVANGVHWLSYVVFLVFWVQASDDTVLARLAKSSRVRETPKWFSLSST